MDQSQQRFVEESRQALKISPGMLPEDPARKARLDFLEIHARIADEIPPWIRSRVEEGVCHHKEQIYPEVPPGSPLEVHLMISLEISS